MPGQHPRQHTHHQHAWPPKYKTQNINYPHLTPQNPAHVIARPQPRFHDLWCVRFGSRTKTKILTSAHCAVTPWHLTGCRSRLRGRSESKNAPRPKSGASARDTSVLPRIPYQLQNSCAHYSTTVWSNTPLDATCQSWHVAPVPRQRSSC